MSIDIRISASTVSVKRKGISLTDCRIEKSKKRNKALSSDKIEVPVKQSSEMVDKQKRRNSDCIENNDIVKKKERSSRKLMKYEKKYRYLEKVCHEYVSPRDNQNKSTLETNDSKSTKLSTLTLLGLAQEVLNLEREVNAVLSSRSPRQCYDFKSNIITDDSCKSIDFLLKLDEVKMKLLDEYDLDLSNKGTTYDDSRQFKNDATKDSTISSFSDDLSDTDIEWTTAIESDSSRLDEDEQMIDLLTEEILMNLQKSTSEVTPNCARNSFDENEETNFSDIAPVLSDIPKILPSFSRNSLLHKEKPPASLMCKQYKRMEIDFTIHELSAIYETDSDGSRGQTTIASLKS